MQNALWGTDKGGVVTFSSGTHADLGLIFTTTSMTIQGADGSVLTGNTRLQIAHSDVTVKNMTFNEMTPRAAGVDGEAILIGNFYTTSGGDISNVTISNNTITNTGDHGIRLLDYRDNNVSNTIENLSITDNYLQNIGGRATNGGLYTGITVYEQGLFRNLFISGNTIDTATFAGINLGKSGVINGHINGNTISNMPASAIQKATERTHAEGRLSGGEASLAIYDNTISNTNRAGTDGTDIGTPNTLRAAITVRGGDEANALIYDNSVSDSYNGILLCVLTCVQEDENGNRLAANFNTSETPHRPIVVYRNSFADNSGFDMVNLSPTRLFAQFNHWGGPDPAGRVSGNVSYSPYYTDAALTTIAETPRQRSGLTVGQPACSVSVGDPVTFSLVTGGESPVVSRTLTGGGTDVTGMRLQVDRWTDRSDNEYSTLATFVKVGGQFVELVPGQFVSLGDGLFSSGTAQVELKVVHSGRVLPTGDGSLSQAISFFASCG